MNDHNETHETLSDQMAEEKEGNSRRLRKSGDRRILPLPLIAHSEAACPECKRLGLKPVTSAPTTIAPHTALVFRAQTQDVFKPTQLVISGDDLNGAYIEDIKIGNISQLSGQGRLPAGAFKDKETAPELDIDCAQVSQEVSVRIRNDSDKPMVCEPFFVGFVARL